MFFIFKKMYFPGTIDNTAYPGCVGVIISGNGIGAGHGGYGGGADHSNLTAGKFMCTCLYSTMYVNKCRWHLLPEKKATYGGKSRIWSN